MLGTGDHAKVRGGFKQVISLLGVPATWTQVLPPNATLTATVGFKTAGKNDSEVVNSYGIGAKIITFDADNFRTQPPKKFDKLEVMGEVYILDEVMMVHLNGEVVGFKAYARGK